MPRQTLLLIITLGLVTSVLIFLALRSQPTPKAVENPPIPTPTPAEQTRIMIMPNPAQIPSTAKSSILTVDIDTGNNKVKGIQFELSYDPSVITNVVITPGTFFDSPEVLFNTVDQKRGRIRYAVGGQLLTPGKSGKGTAAIITFRGVGTSGQSTKVDFIPQSIIAAEDVSANALSSETGTTLLFSK